MMLVCPHCGLSLNVPPQTHGGALQCPRCHGSFYAPPTIPTANELISHAPAPVQPSLVINTSPPRERRLQSGGWFARSFMTTTGVVLAVLLFLVGIPALIMFTACGGCLAVGTQAINEASKAHESRSNEVVTQAKIALRKYGVTGDISDDSVGTEYVIEPGVTHAAHGSVRTKEGVERYRVWFHVAQFGQEKIWTVKRVEVGDKVLLDGEKTSVEKASSQ